MPLCRHCVGNELTRKSQSSQLAETLSSDPGLKSGISVRDLFSTSKKKKKKAQAGMNGRAFSQNSHQRGKSHNHCLVLWSSPSSLFKTCISFVFCQAPCGSDGVTDVRMAKSTYYSVCRLSCLFFLLSAVRQHPEDCWRGGLSYELLFDVKRPVNRENHKSSKSQSLVRS